MNDKTKKLFLFSFILLLVLVFYITGSYQHLTLPNIQKNLDEIRVFYDRSPIFMVTLFMVAYIAITSLSIPGSIVLTLLAGAIFDVYLGTLLVSVACTIGATLAFFMSRYFFRESVMYKFRNQFQKLNYKFKRHGNSYLFTLRLIPVSPFVIINLLMGLTTVRTWSYIWITFIAMLPGNFVYVYAGRKISEISSASEILTWPIILILTVIGISPFVFKWLITSYGKENLEH